MYLHIPTALGSLVAALLISQATPASAATYVFEAQGTYTYDFDANDAYYYSQDPGERDETVTKTGTVILEVRGEDRNNDKKLTSKTSPTATGHELTWFSIKFEDENGASHWLLHGGSDEANHAVTGHFDFLTRNLNLSYQFLNSSLCWGEYGFASLDTARYYQSCTEGDYTWGATIDTAFRQVAGPVVYMSVIPLPPTAALMVPALLGGIFLRRKRRSRAA